MKRASAVLVGLALAACAPAPETPEQARARMEQETAAARTAIEAQAARFSANFSNADSIAALYTENGIQGPPNMPMVQGREAIRKGHADFLAMGTSTVALKTESVAASGDMAVERGSYVFTFQPGPKAPRGMKAETDTGKYLAHWHRVNGEWLMAEDFYNSDKPAR